MPLPGLAERLAADGQAIAETAPVEEFAPPTIEGLSAEVLALGAQVARLTAERDDARTHFQRSDAQIGAYQTENAQLKGRVSELEAQGLRFASI